MGFSDKDRILLENLYIYKSYGANKLIREFPNKDWQCSTTNCVNGWQHWCSVVFILCIL